MCISGTLSVTFPEPAGEIVWGWTDEGRHLRLGTRSGEEGLGSRIKNPVREIWDSKMALGW